MFCLLQYCNYLFEESILRYLVILWEHSQPDKKEYLGKYALMEYFNTPFFSLSPDAW